MSHFFKYLNVVDDGFHHLTIKLKVRIYSAYILIVPLHSSETWCTCRRQENRLKAFHFRWLHLGRKRGRSRGVHFPGRRIFMGMQNHREGRRKLPTMSQVLSSAQYIYF